MGGGGWAHGMNGGAMPAIVTPLSLGPYGHEASDVRSVPDPLVLLL